MFNGVSIQAFNKFFKSEDDCKQYLFDFKWKDGYRCRNCGCTKSHKGKTKLQYFVSDIYTARHVSLSLSGHKYDEQQEIQQLLISF